MTTPEAVVACVGIICAATVLGIIAWRGQSPGSRYLDHIERQTPTWSITPRDEETDRE